MAQSSALTRTTSNVASATFRNLHHDEWCALAASLGFSKTPKTNVSGMEEWAKRLDGDYPDAWHWPPGFYLRWDAASNLNLYYRSDSMVDSSIVLGLPTRGQVAAAITTALLTGRFPHDA